MVDNLPTKVRLTDTILRDAHQSLLATRMRTRDMLPIAEKLDAVGFFSLEVWGGATFDSCIRFLNEDPWERLRSLKRVMKRTPLQMLLRGQNLVGYRHYADDVVERFVVLAVRNGVDIFRIFDALNDIRNLELAIKIVKREGAHVQGAISYTISPVHTIEHFAEMAVHLEQLGCDSVCIKDMAGLISPTATYDLIKAIRQKVSVPISLHSHCTAGLATTSTYVAAQAGANILDTAISPLSGGTSQPPTESIVAAFQGTPYDTGLDLVLLTEIKRYFDGIREKYAGLIDPIAERVDVGVYLHQIPGGMISNLTSQLKQQNALDKYDEVIHELPRVRAEMGYPPLVTPTSQIVGTQAVFNVLMGERYKTIPQEVRDYFKGLYGKPPGQLDPQIKKLVIGDEEPITQRPADLIPPQLEKLQAEMERLGIGRSEEDLATFALYPDAAAKFLRGEVKEEELKGAQTKADPPKKAVVLEPKVFTVEVEGETYKVRVVPSGEVTEVARKGEAAVGRPVEPLDGAVVAPTQGLVLGIKVTVGQMVQQGDTLVVLEAMKMQNSIVAPHTGTVVEIYTAEGETVHANDVLLVVVKGGIDGV